MTINLRRSRRHVKINEDNVEIGGNIRVCESVCESQTYNNDSLLEDDCETILGMNQLNQSMKKQKQDAEFLNNQATNVINSADVKMDNKLNHIPTVINDGQEMWGKFGLKRIMNNGNGVFVFKFDNLQGLNTVIESGPWIMNNKPMSTKGLSALASRIGTPLIMDAMTTSMCNQGISRLAYARVLVEVNNDKVLPSHIDVMYRNSNNDEKFVKRCPQLVNKNEQNQNIMKDNEGFISKRNRRFNDLERAKNKLLVKNGRYGERNMEPKKFIYRQKEKKDDTNMVDELGKKAMEYFKKKWGKQDDKDKNIKKEENDDDIDIELDENDMDLNLATWNIRGLGKLSKQNEVKNLIRNERLSICAVLETHMKNDKIRNICMNVFGSWLWQNNVSLSRKGCRIAVGWDASNVKCTLITATGQSMLYEVEKELTLNKRITGSPEWIIMGDVNVSLNLEDHSEGMSNFTQDMIDFQECINEIEIKDISSSGLHFTWTKSLLNPSSSILKKIDRVMGNNAFLSKYSTANALFFPYGISDHSLAILKVPQAMKKKIKSFRIANYVIEKLEFKDMVKEKWNLEIQRHHMYKLVKKLKSPKPYLNKLNWKNGNLFERVVVLKAKLYDVQRKIDMNPTNKALRIEGVELLKDYKEVVLDEEKLLRHKTKITWLREGDKNSAYFHKVLKGRINRNKIMSVCAEDGSRFENCDVANQFVKHFEGFLGISPDVTSLNEDADNLFVSKISKKQANNMIREINDEEIKKVLFDIDDDKAPRPDGEINVTLISLVPKSLTPQKVSGRAITDNILLTQELLKGYNCINGPKRCSFKIDIQKAYDTFTICVNGERFGYFKGGRGLRQGDPISLYVFTMLRITHLCFADDLIMLCNGDIVSVKTLKKALDKFSAISGLYPNLGKCTMFCSSIDDETKENISKIFPIKEGKIPVRQKLSDWKNKSLSYAGRAQLIAFVLGLMQVYWGSIFLLPKTVINEIEGMFKKFLWNNGESYKGKAKVAWLELCKPKDQGGLGFKYLELWNKTLLDISIDPKDSWRWKCLLNLRSWVSDHMRYRIGDGKSINVWHDKWNNETSLSSVISKKEIFYAGFSDIDKISDAMDGEASSLSKSLDKPVWVDNNGIDKKFSTSIVWKDVIRENGKVSWYKIVWHPNCIPKHTFILWIAVKKRLCTQDIMAKWYPSKVFKCSLCKKEPDSHDHLFFNCEYAQKVWKKVCTLARMKFKVDTWVNIVEELSSNQNSNNVWTVIKNLCLATAVYYIWQERNMRLFQNSKREANDLAKIMIEELKAKMVYIAVKNSNNVLLA
ncbi:RNA-directed DNA polymerase, eukaryota, reverse transcriptase zinc-binding domain protein [Tanacetum coccineum]